MQDDYVYRMTMLTGDYVGAKTTLTGGLDRKTMLTEILYVDKKTTHSGRIVWLDYPMYL